MTRNPGKHPPGPGITRNPDANYVNPFCLTKGHANRARLAFAENVPGSVSRFLGTPKPPAPVGVGGVGLDVGDESDELTECALFVPLGYVGELGKVGSVVQAR